MTPTTMQTTTTAKHASKTYKMPRGDDIRFYPLVGGRANAAEGRHVIDVAAGQPNRPRLRGSHRQTVLDDGGGRYTATTNVVSQVTGSKDKQVLRVLRRACEGTGRGEEGGRRRERR